MKLAAKGRIGPDSSYLYTCGLCHGQGNNADCPWCYGLNVERIAEEMRKGARGQRYYSLLKAHLSVTGKAMVDDFERLRAERGRVTPVEVAYVALKYQLNFKATWEWLAETHCLRKDYDDVRLRFTVGAVYEQAREEYPELNGK